MPVTFPGESPEYRVARNRLLAQEIELRRVTESVAAARRELPPGGPAPTNYVFQGAGPVGTPTDVKLSELFAPGKESLVLYSFMFPRDPGDQSPGPATGQTAELPLAEGPCPSCTALIDQLHGAAEHTSQLVNLAIVAKAPLPPVLAFAAERRWSRLRFLSSATNTYNRDYHAETPDGIQRPMLTVSTGTATGSVTSGARRCSTRLPSRVRSPGTSAHSSRSGTCSTSLPKDARRIGTSTSTTPEAEPL